MQQNLDILIPVIIDHDDRKRNLEIVLNFLTKSGFKNIFVREYFYDKSKIEDLANKFSSANFSFFKNNEFNYFNKMKCINELSELSMQDIACWYDVDVLISKLSLITATGLILQNRFDIVYPYNGNFYDIPADIVNKLTTNILTPIDLSQCTLFNPNSYGGCAVFSKKCFNEGGRCNPNFKNVGYDDDEFLLRFTRLDYNIGRTEGVLLHLNHFRGNTSFNHNDFTNNNINEIRKISAMSPNEIREYIKTW